MNCVLSLQVTQEEKAQLLDESVVVKVSPVYEYGNADMCQFVRFVTHADVSSEDMALVVKKLKYVISEIENANQNIKPEA